MKHIRGFENDVAVLALDRFFIRPLVAVVQLSATIPVDGHLVGHEWVQGNDFTFAVTDDLRIGVAPQEQVRHQRLAEHET